MATQYINEDKKIIFLNNKNIAQNRTDIDAIAYNAIPSLSLFNGTYAELTGKANDIELSTYGLSGYVNSLCGQISDEIKFQAETAKSYTEQLSAEFETISGDLRGAVTVYDKNNNGHELSVRKLTNEQYNELVANDQTQWNELYVINDEYRDLRGQQIRNLGEPYSPTDATTKSYVDTTENSLSIATFNEAKAYANSISGEPLKDAKDYADANFADYDNFEFTYDNSGHALKLRLNNMIGNSKELSVDATYFISNGIINHIETNFDSQTLIIYWKTNDGDTKALPIPLQNLVTIYKQAEQNGGILIVPTSSGYVLSCDDTIARKSMLDDYQLAGNYVTDDSLEDRLESLSSDLNSCYINKKENSNTNAGIYTTYTIDEGHNGGIRLDSPVTGQYDRTEYGYEGINITRNSESNTEYFKFANDPSNNGIARIKDIDAKYQEIINQNYIKKSDFYDKIKTITSSSTFNEVIQVLLDLQALTNVE